jgi:hypothetical protein
MKFLVAAFFMACSMVIVAGYAVYDFLRKRWAERSRPIPAQNHDMGGSG